MVGRAVIGLIGSVALAACLAPPASVRCQQPTDCPTDYTCDPGSRVCVRVDTVVDAAVGDATSGDAMTRDRNAGDASSGDGEVADRRTDSAGSESAVFDGAAGDGSGDRWSTDRITADLARRDHQATDAHPGIDGAPVLDATSPVDSATISDSATGRDTATISDSAVTPDAPAGADTVAIPDATTGVDAAAGVDGAALVDAAHAGDGCVVDCSGRCAPATSCGQLCPAQCGSGQWCDIAGQCHPDYCADEPALCVNCYSTRCVNTAQGAQCECQVGYSWNQARRRCEFADDGELILRSGDTYDLAADTRSSFRDCGDGVVLPVSALDDSRAILAPASAAACCLGPGDQVLLINLQGDNVLDLFVGAHESLTVDSESHDVVSFMARRQQCLGEAMCLSSTPSPVGSQKIALVRVPRYRSVDVGAGATLASRNWSATIAGGVLALQVVDRMDVAGVVTMSGAGFAGGRSRCSTDTHRGQQGESLIGIGRDATGANAGAGGGGCFDPPVCQFSGAGGGYGTAGAPGSSSAICMTITCREPAGGVAYPQSPLVFPDRRYLGSGGGGGACDGEIPCLCASGGAGGGLIQIEARDLHVSGEISADGIWPFGRDGQGGGGSGGSIVISVDSATLGDGLVHAIGGHDPRAGNTSAGGGRISVRCALGECLGTTIPRSQ